MRDELRDTHATSYRMLAAATHHPDFLNQSMGLFNVRSIEALVNRDVDVDVVSPRPFAPPRGPYSDYRKIPSVSRYKTYAIHYPRFFYGVPKRLFYGISGTSYAKRVPRYIERTFPEPDVVHAYNIYLDGYGMIPYCRTHDLPLFVVAHGYELNKFDGFRQGIQSKIRETLETCDEVLCVSEALANCATKIVPDVETRVVPIGANPDVFPVDQNDRIRQELGIPLDVPIVLFCGHYIERKGIPEIMEVLPLLEDLNAYFLFVGQDNRLRLPLQRAILDAGMTNCARVEYDVTNIALHRFFAIADLLLLPSHSEGRPTVIYEAMASETAVLASNVNGIPEQVTDGETGKLIPPKDVGALRNALQELCSDKTRLQKMGRAGHQTLLKEGWTWEAHAEQVERIHREYVGNETT